MNKKLLCFLISFSVWSTAVVHSASAQSYIPMLNDSLYWDVAYAVNNPSPCAIYGVTGPVRYALGNDTLFNGIAYKQLKGFPFQVFSPSGCPPFAVDTVSQAYEIYLREDTATKTVYSFNPLSQAESLLFDFSLQQHDSIFLPSFISPNNYFYVDTLYSIVTADGLSRKYFECFPRPNQGTTGGYYIEGLGGAMGPFTRPYNKFEEGYWIMCIRDLNESAIYGYTGNCFDFITGIHPIENTNKQITLYPVPAEELLFLENYSGDDVYSIVNTLGEPVLTGKIPDDSAIPVSNLKPGLYSIRFKSENKWNAAKFIKQ